MENVKLTGSTRTSIYIYIYIYGINFWNMVVIYDNKDFLNSFWANLVERHQNWLFKVRFGSYTNSNMLNSMMIFTFLCFETKIPFFGPKNQNCLFKMKFGTKTNSNLLNSMVMFAFSLLDRKYPFWAIKAKLFV